jgi:hypothetical protein
MADQIVEPCEQQMGFVAQLAGERTRAGLERFQPAAQPIGFRSGQGGYRREIALVPVLTDGCLGQQLHLDVLRISLGRYKKFRAADPGRPILGG